MHRKNIHLKQIDGRERAMIDKELYQFIGRKLSKDIHNKNGALLLKKGTVLSPKAIDRLIRQNIKMFDLFNESVMEDTTKLLTPYEQELLIDNAAGEIREIFSKVKHDKETLEELEIKIMPVVKQISCNYELCTLLNGLKSKDDYTYRHNIGVAVLASLLSRWLGFSEEEVNLISLGGLLHDIGKIQIPDKILNKKGRLTEEEYETVKKHTIYGYEILKNSNIYPEIIATMALEHHERNDGKGYPYGKKENEIHEYSKIIAIADVFHAMTSDRVYRRGIPINQVLKQMRSDSFGMLDPKMTSIFIMKIMEMSIGNTVLLSNGAVGKIVFIFRNDPVHPLIRTGDKVIDLRSSNLQIETFLQEPIVT